MSGPGRPSTYSEELADLICERLADGESMRSILRDEGMPARSTVASWLDTHADFRAKCARAREWQADSCDDEVVETINQVRHGMMDPAAARVVLSGLQWRAEKLAPKKYGTKTLHTGPDGESPPQVNVKVSFGE